MVWPGVPPADDISLFMVLGFYEELFGLVYFFLFDAASSVATVKPIANHHVGVIRRDTCAAERPLVPWTAVSSATRFRFCTP